VENFSVRFFFRAARLPASCVARQRPLQRIAAFLCRLLQRILEVNPTARIARCVSAVCAHNLPGGLLSQCGRSFGRTADLAAAAEGTVHDFFTDVSNQQRSGGLSQRQYKKERKMLQPIPILHRLSRPTRTSETPAHIPFHLDLLFLLARLSAE
jgi:hypothetical protein